METFMKKILFLCLAITSVCHGHMMDYIGNNEGLMSKDRWEKLPQAEKDAVPTKADAELWAAVRACDSKGIQAALRKGANTESKDPMGNTPLLKLIATPCSINAFYELMRGGASVYAQNNDGRTAVHMAAVANQHLEVLKTLSAHGAELDRPDSHGQTPTTLAIRACSAQALDFLTLRVKPVKPLTHLEFFRLAECDSVEKSERLKKAYFR